MEKQRMFSLKTQISRVLITGLCAVILMMIVFLTVLVQQYQNSQDEKRLTELTAYASTLNENIVQINDVLGSVYSTNPAFQGLDQYRSYAEKCDYMYTLQNLFKMQVQSNGNLDGMFVYYDNLENFLHYFNEEISFEEKEQLRKNGRAVSESIARNYSQIVLTTEEKVYYGAYLKRQTAVIGGVTSFERGLPDELEKEAAYGIIYENRFHKAVGEALELLPEECEKLTSEKNKVGRHMVYKQEIGNTGMYVAEILPISLWLYVNGIHILLGILTVVLAYCALRLYRLLTSSLIKPLEDMNEALQQLQAGVWEVHFPRGNRIEEIDNVQKTVQVFLKEIEAYKIRTYEEKLARQSMQLQYLQLQLAPHFYTNCLKNAYYMLMLGEYENVESFLLHLSSHLRYLLQKDVTMVSLGQECDFVQNYIELQKLMTAKGLFCEILIDEEVRHLSVPLLSLQTFVENSVKYGRNMEEKELVITIRAKYRKTEETTYLDIQVKDNGPGYSKELLHMLNQGEIPEDSRLGVGILNLLHRMRIQYGTEVNWYFENDNGAVSELFLPVKQEEADADITGR